MKAYLPKNYLQTDLHLENKERLYNFIKLLNDLKLDTAIGKDIPVHNNGLLILTTRNPKIKLYNKEINRIYEFVNKGGSLFHLSNHSNLHIKDSNIGKVFGYEFQDYYIKSKVTIPTIDTSLPSIFSVKTKEDAQKIFKDSSKKFAIINGTSIIKNKNFETIAKYGPGAYDSKSEKNINNVENTVFCICSRRNSFSGKIVAISDSGLIGKPTSDELYPGPGLSEGNNKQLIKEIISWLIS
mgnify:CR=1 FL=1